MPPWTLDGESSFGTSVLHQSGQLSLLSAVSLGYLPLPLPAHPSPPIHDIAITTTMARTPSQSQKHANAISQQLDGAVHSIEKKIEEQAELHARNPQDQKEAGLFQLLICVGGIYASL